MEKESWDKSMLNLKEQWHDYVYNNAKLHTNLIESIKDLTKGQLSSLFTIQYKKVWNGRIGRNGDIWMGLHLSECSRQTIELSVMIGENYVTSITISPGEKKLSLENATFFGLINIPYQEVVLSFNCEESDNLQIIYGNLSRIPRQYLALNSNYYIVPDAFRSRFTKSKPLIISRSCMLCPIKIEEKIPYTIKIPDIWESIDGHCLYRSIIEKSSHKTKIWKKQLIEKTCHPDRINHWCIDIEEMNDMQSLDLCKYLGNDDNIKIWYDEVLIISSDTKPETHNLKVLKHNAKGLIFKFLSSDGKTFMKIRGKENRYLAFDSDKPYWIEKYSKINRKYSEI